MPSTEDQGSLSSETVSDTELPPVSPEQPMPQEPETSSGTGTLQTPPAQPLPQPPGLAQPGVRSLENLIATALEPVGSTMYIWGGGWNEADTGAGTEALSIGCSARWAAFASAQDSSYNHNDHRYQIHDGLDCSGYIGWTIYNVFRSSNSQSESDGYVMKARTMAETFAGYGWGSFIPAGSATDWKPGDICSMSGHVWLSLGTCRDGSVLLLHSSPPGVRLCGTLSADGSKTDAVALAEKWMSRCYPGWYAKYPKCSVDYSYLTSSSLMRWNDDTLAGASQLQALSAEEIADRFYR